MKENDWRTKWLLDVLTALGGPGNEHAESLLYVLMYIGQNKEYKSTWEEAVRLNGLVLPTLDGVATRAIQFMCNMNKSQIKLLHSYLKVESGSTVFLWSSRSYSLLVLSMWNQRMAPTSMGRRKLAGPTS
jgi:hypothetical protein